MTAYPPDDEVTPLDVDTIRVALFTNAVQPEFTRSDEYRAEAFTGSGGAPWPNPWTSHAAAGGTVDIAANRGRQFLGVYRSEMERQGVMTRWWFFVKPLPRPWKGGRAGVRFRQRRRR